MSLVFMWLARRALEVGGILGAALTAWNNLPPGVQDGVLALLGRRWQEITLGAAIPLAISLWGYVWSFISTTRNQVVVDGHQTPVKKNSAAAAKVEAIAQSATPPKTLIDRMAEMFGRRKGS